MDEMSRKREMNRVLIGWLRIWKLNDKDSTIFIFNQAEYARVIPLCINANDNLWLRVLLHLGSKNVIYQIVPVSQPETP